MEAVLALVQSINEAIAAATTYMALPEPERYDFGQKAAHMTARTVAHALSLQPRPAPRRTVIDQFELPPEPPVTNERAAMSSVVSAPSVPPRLSVLRSLIASIVRGVSYIVTTSICLVVGTSILTGVVWASAELRLSVEQSGLDYTSIMDEIASAIQKSPFIDLCEGVLWMLLVLVVIAVGVRSTRHAIDAVIHIVRQSNRNAFGFPLVESRCVPAIVSRWCGNVVETCPLTSAHVLAAGRFLVGLIGP